MSCTVRFCDTLTSHRGNSFCTGTTHTEQIWLHPSTSHGRAVDEIARQPSRYIISENLGSNPAGFEALRSRTYHESALEKNSQSLTCTYIHTLYINTLNTYLNRPQKATYCSKLLPCHGFHLYSVVKCFSYDVFPASEGHRERRWIKQIQEEAPCIRVMTTSH